MRTVSTALLALSLSACALPWSMGPAGGPTPDLSLLPARERIPLTPPFDGVQWGMLVVDAADGAVLFEHNSARRFIPASNRKVAVTVAALHLLGPEFRWETGFHAGGEFRGGVVEGDLILSASGDPTFGPPFHPSWEAALDSMASTLERAGVRSVWGDLVVEASRWDTTSVPGSWMVEDLGEISGAPFAPFSLAGAELELELRPGDWPGAPVVVERRPGGEEGYLLNQLITLPEPAGSAEGAGAVPFRAVHRPESTQLTLQGGVPVGAGRTVRTALRDPMRESAHALLGALRARGIEVAGRVRIDAAPGDPASVRCHAWSSPREEGVIRLPACPGLPKIAELRSPPLTEVAGAILGPSQNWMTEQLLRTLGAALEGEGSLAAGLRAERRFVEEVAGLDPLEVTGRDGSGMSTQNLLSPRAVVRMYALAEGAFWREEWLDALAAPGEAESTLENRLLPLAERFRGKTGTLTNVTSLSGVVETDSGRRLLFAILSNGSGLPTSTVRGAIDEIVAEIAADGGVQPFPAPVR